MSAHAEPWAPAGALFDDTLAGLVGARARAWAARWFGAGKTIDIRVCDGARCAGPPSGATTWESLEPGLVLALDPRAHTPIACWMLGLDTGTRVLKEAEQKLFQDLACTTAQDFIRDVAGVFSLGPDTRERGAYRHGRDDIALNVSIGAASNVLNLYALRPRAIKARLDAIGPRSPRAAPKHRDDAIRRQPIRVGAMIGRGRMALSELCSLTVGDVIMLDRGHNDGMALTVDGQTKPDTICELRQDGSQLTLRLAQTEASTLS
ncbi:MAG: FliM/FliN family flagellar motor switch protein [Phycisphaerales bacterium]|nr:FliM/FliN family flagellar motor switch protein [Hyphomonadaceae bacterium]